MLNRQNPLRTPSSMQCIRERNCNVFRVFVVFLFFQVHQKCISQYVSPSPSSQHLAKAHIEFSLSMFTRLATMENAFISPLSIANALSMAALGTTEGSENARQFEHVLRRSERTFGIFKQFPERFEGVSFGVSFGSVSSAWIAKHVRESYLRSLKSKLNADVFPLSRNATAINEWVRKSSRGMISHVVDTVPPDSAVALLISAAFFEGQWQFPFALNDTAEAPFFLGDGSVKQVPMMSTFDPNINYADIELTSAKGGFEIFDLPYGNGLYAATIVLPRAFTALTAVLAELEHSGEKWDKWIARMRSTRIMSLKLPRFKVSFEADLKAVLISMGLRTAFELSTQNQFERITFQKGMVINSVVHKAVLTVTEDGTRAGAVSAVGISLLSFSPLHLVDVVANKPFLIFIRHSKNGAIIFCGRIDNPERF